MTREDTWISLGGVDAWTLCLDWRWIGILMGGPSGEVGDRVEQENAGRGRQLEMSI